VCVSQVERSGIAMMASAEALHVRNSERAALDHHPSSDTY